MTLQLASTSVAPGNKENAAPVPGSTIPERDNPGMSSSGPNITATDAPANPTPQAPPTPTTAIPSVPVKKRPLNYKPTIIEQAEFVSAYYSFCTVYYQNVL